MKRSAQRAVMEYACDYALGYAVAEDAIPSLSGKTDRQIIREILNNLGIPEINNENITNSFLEGLRIATPKHCTIETVTALNGVRELVEYLHTDSEITLGLLTGNNRECAYFKLAPLELDTLFAFGAFGCDHHDRRKLPPIAIERGNSIMGENLFSTDSTLIIGDAPGDISCAKANNIPVLAVATGRFSYEELLNEGADVVLNNFADVQFTKSTIENLLSI
jgi:phosphoglycolate phosphatase-like HAD superfamily hydrolase